MTKPSIGVIFHPTFPPETLVNYAQQAEAAGFDEVWLWEDSFWAGALTCCQATFSQVRIALDAHGSADAQHGRQPTRQVIASAQIAYQV